MCGIAGMFRVRDAAAARREVERMMRSIVHRGPDGQGIVEQPGLVLGHVRLAILDLSDLAAQPMPSRSGRLAISFNGEIFNFQDLRRRLTDRGFALRSTGDTEVLVELIDAFGLDETLALLEGDFAIALWDARDRTLTLARDRHGIKPLCYRETPGGELAFASEVKALASWGLEPDMPGVDAALLGLSCTWGERTLFRNVRSVRPGEYLRFGMDGSRSGRRFFDLASWVDGALVAQYEAKSDREVVDDVAARFDESVRLRQISDAPVACMVSGGVDSNLVAWSAAKSGQKPALYHADVVNDSERPAAEFLAKRLGLELRTVEVSDRRFLDEVASVTWHNEIPVIYHMNSVPFYVVSRLASKDGIKVVLTGEGSDEYFLGYPQYALGPVLRKIEAVRGFFQRGLHGVSPKLGGILWPHDRDRLSESLRTLVFRAEQDLFRTEGERVYSFVKGAADRRDHVMTLTLARAHLVSLLHRNDRLGMAWGIESRFPFLGHALAEAALNLPGRFKLRRTMKLHDRRHPFIVDKWVIRRIAEMRLGKELAHRAKRGFPVSVYQRIRIDPGFFKDGFVADAYGLDDTALAAIAGTASRLWLARLLMLEIWGRMFIRQKSVDDSREHLLRFVEA